MKRKTNYHQLRQVYTFFIKNNRANRPIDAEKKGFMYYLRLIWNAIKSFVKNLIPQYA